GVVPATAVELVLAGPAAIVGRVVVGAIGIRGVVDEEMAGHTARDGEGLRLQRVDARLLDGDDEIGRHLYDVLSRAGGSSRRRSDGGRRPAGFHHFGLLRNAYA